MIDLARQYSTVFRFQFEGERIQWDQYDQAFLNKIGACLGINDKVRVSIFKAIEKRNTAFTGRLNKPLSLSEDAAYIYRAFITSKWGKFYWFLLNLFCIKKICDLEQCLVHYFLGKDYIIY